MNSKELSLPPQETTTSAMIRPTATIAQTVSNECLKVTELSEQCKIAETLLKEYETKVQALTNSKQECEKLKSEYAMRNKINLTNSESLLQAKNELLKYKCQLKSDYISTENALKNQQLKFRRIILNYESEWQKTLKHYNSHQFVLELSQLEEENKTLENEIEKIQNLKINSEREFNELQRKVWQKFVVKVVQFSKTIVEKNEILSSKKYIKPNVAQKSPQKHIAGVEFNFFRTAIPALNLQAYANVPKPCDSLYSVDMSMFDDVSIPTENLEIRNEDELFSFIHIDTNTPNKTEDSEEEKMDVDQAPVTPNKSSGDYSEEENQKQNTSGKESEYFSECQEPENQIHRWNRAQGGRIDVEEIEGNLQERVKRQKTVGEKIRNEEIGKEVQEVLVENEENSSDGSFENHFGYHNKQSENKHPNPMGYTENYAYQYHSRTPSVSSDEISQPTNENIGSPKLQQQPHNLEKSTNSFLDQDSGFKGFSGFFTMDNDWDSPKPSIFKLF